MSDKYLFSVTTADIANNGEVVFDSDGYCTHPIAVINHKTENDTFYLPEVFLKQLTDTSNIFRRNLERGNLFGEADHPDVKGTVEDIPRLLTVAQDRLSHHFKSIETVPLAGLPGSYLILGKLKPLGKFGKHLLESLNSKYVNTSFSLRSIIKEKLDPVTLLRMREILQLVTFDWVTVPGSPEASKRYTNIGVESYSHVLTASMINDAVNDKIKSVGLEATSNYAVKKLLGDMEITIRTDTISLSGFRDSGSKNIINNSGSNSIVHAALIGKGGIS